MPGEAGAYELANSPAAIRPSLSSGLRSGTRAAVRALTQLRSLFQRRVKADAARLPARQSSHDLLGRAGQVGHHVPMVGVRCQKGLAPVT